MFPIFYFSMSAWDGSSFSPLLPAQSMRLRTRSWPVMPRASARSSWMSSEPHSTTLTGFAIHGFLFWISRVMQHCPNCRISTLIFCICRRGMAWWILMTSVLASFLWVMIWWVHLVLVKIWLPLLFFVTQRHKINFLYKELILIETLLFFFFFSGWSWICTHYDSGGPQQHRSCHLPGLYWLHDQGDGRDWHCWTGHGLLQDISFWQGNSKQLRTIKRTFLRICQIWLLLSKHHFFILLYSTGLHYSGGVEKGAAPRTSRILYQPHDKVHGWRCSPRRPWLYLLLQCPIWRKRPIEPFLSHLPPTPFPKILETLKTSNSKNNVRCNGWPCCNDLVLCVTSWYEGHPSIAIWSMLVVCSWWWWKVLTSQWGLKSTKTRQNTILHIGIW